VESLQRELSRRGLHGAFITSMESIRYLTGHYVWTSYSPLTFAVVPTAGAPTLFVPAADESLARVTSRIHVEPYNPGTRGYAAGADLCRDLLARTTSTPGKLGVEVGAITLERVRALEGALARWTLDDVTPVVNRLRLIKDDTEQGAFRRAAELMAHALRTTAGALTPGMSELEIKGAFDQALYAESSRRWPDAMAVAQTNVLSGDRLGRLHDGSRGRRVNAGEPVWILSHAHWNGYWANISRTVFVPGGRTDPNVVHAQAAVVEAQRAAIASLAPGQALGNAAKACDDVLASRNLLDKKIYTMFRGLGLRYDEPPRGTDLDAVMEAGMCLAVAVHVRLPMLIVGQGDSVLITANGPEVVS
jgi:Xaa-Pro aminopeptidase